ncbi:MAG: hypothetical protein OXU63_05410 [Acidobacteriota bacterium]|nr:hypothetical protein [Acidobacteriota bacterium]
MAPSTTSNPVTRQGGLALIVGVILLVLASLLFPGGVVDAVDQTDFSAALGAAAANASLAHLASMLSIIGMFLYGYAAFTWLRLAQQGPGGLCLRLGAYVSVFGWSLYVVAMGMRQFSVHLMQRGMEDLALGTYVSMAGIVIALVSVYPIGSILVGLGLSARFSSTNIFKLASYGFVLLGVLAIINFLVLQHVSGIEPRQGLNPGQVPVRTVRDEGEREDLLPDRRRSSRFEPDNRRTPDCHP